MKIITLEDCYELEKKFREYTKTAEQHEFTLLLMLDMMLTKTLIHYESIGDVTDQNTANTMFRVILGTIGEDYSEYMEDNKHD